MLQLEIDARRDLQAVAEQRLGTEAVLNELAHVGREVRRFARTEARRRNEIQWCPVHALALGERDRTCPHHLIEHVLLALSGGREIGVWIVVGRRLGQPGEKRGLGQGQLFGGLAEVCLGGGLDAVRAIPERDLVEVHLEDLVFGVATRELHGQKRFFDLALGGLLRPEEGVLDKLLRDG
jgi:hypothetical protein